MILHVQNPVATNFAMEGTFARSDNLLHMSPVRACTGSRLPVLTRTRGKRTLQSPKSNTLSRAGTGMSESRRPGRRRRRRSCDGTGLGRGPVTGVRAGSREEERERERERELY